MALRVGVARIARGERAGAVGEEAEGGELLGGGDGHGQATHYPPAAPGHTPGQARPWSSDTNNTMARLFSCYVTQCLCCSLRSGIVVLSVLALVNAGLAFAGEAALFSGLLSAVSLQSAGKFLPAGTPLDPHDKTLHGGLIFLGLYSLTLGTLGLLASIGRKLWAATLFLVMTFLDVAAGVLVTVVLWLGGLSMSGIIAQLPVLIVNVYFVSGLRYRN